VANASSTTVDGASTVRADALVQGDGGTVVLWSEQQTSFAGTTSARGGPSGGDGGFLEVSSKGGVGFSGAVDAAAPAGKAGSVLFDPKNIIIDSSANILVEDNLQFNGSAVWDKEMKSAVLTPSNNNSAVLVPSNNNNFAFTLPNNNNFASTLPNINTPAYTPPNNSAELSPSNANKAGSFFYNTAISLDNDVSFSTSFQFKISASIGDGGEDGADGLVFVVKNRHAKAIGGTGEGLGYTGIQNSLGVEFDTFKNSSQNDPSGNHVGVNLNGSVDSSENSKTIETSFNNGLPWTAWIDYNDLSKTLDVRLANDSITRPVVPALSYAFEKGKGLKDIIGVVDGSSLASFGFTAATGASTGKHEILSWSFFGPSYSSFSSNPSGDLLLQPAQIQTIASQGTNVMLQANNDITLRPNSSITIQSPTAGSGGISMQAGRSITLQSPITYVGNYSGPINLIANDTSLLPSFRDIGAGNLTVDTGANLTSSQALVSLRLGPGNDVYSPGVLQVNAPISASTVLARGASGITLSGAAVLTASAPSGRAITLDAGSGAFLNNSTSGAAALSKQPGATWAIYADNPTTTPRANLGDLPYNFKQYNQTFDTNQGSNPILGSGNGLFFANSPTLSVNLTSQVTKTYNGTNTANLVSSNYNLTGVLSGDSVDINQPRSGIYDDKNATSGKLVSVSGLSITSATETATAVPVTATAVLVYGYILGKSTADASIGTITKAPLTISAATDSRRYNGSTSSSGVPTLTAGQVFSGDTLSGLSQVFASKNVLGTNQSTLLVNGYTLNDGNSGNNYAVSLSTASGTITQLDLPVTGLVANNKVYDATTVAPLGGSAAVSPLSGDVVTLSGTAVGAFSDKNVGTNKAVTVTGVTIAGNDAGNYNLLQQTGLAIAISKKDLPVTGLVANNKVYDATTVAPLGGSAAVSPFNGDVVTLSGTAVGAFSDKNVGIDKAVTVTGVTIAGNDAGNYNLVPQTGLTAAIGKKDLPLTGLVANNKVYDATTVAPLGGSAAVSPFNGDDVSVGGTAVGAFADKNVAQTKAVSVSGLSLSGKDAGNYNLLPLTNLKAAITPAPLQISASSDSKIYDGTTQSSLAPKITQGGLWGDDRLTGLAQTYESKNALGAGQSKLIVSAYTLSDGNNGSNYVISFLPGLGTINRASVTPSFTVKSKQYDGNVAAEIAGDSLQGGLASDEVFMVGASAHFDNAYAANDKLVTITGYTLSGQDADNYQLSSPTATSTASITTSITTQQDTDSSLPNDEPIKNEKANPTVGLQLSTLSSATASKSVDVDISNVVLLPPGASALESTPSGSTQSQPTPTAASATSSVPNQSQPTASATAVTTGSATQEYQESDNRSAEDAKTSLGLSNAPSSEPISPARLQLVMQSAASFIRKYPVRTLNQ
jgi:hypothetical protein